jgi:hypothetical protein
MTQKEITIEEVQAYCLIHFPDFMQSSYGNDTFRTDIRFISFSDFADYLRKEGFEKNNDALIQKIADYINLLLAQGDEWVRNPVYVSFIESLVDRSYKYPQLKGFIWQMPEDVRTFIKGYFIEEVLVALDLKSTESNESK